MANHLRDFANAQVHGLDPEELLGQLGQPRNAAEATIYQMIDELSDRVQGLTDQVLFAKNEAQRSGFIIIRSSVIDEAQGLARCIYIYRMAKAGGELD